MEDYKQKYDKAFGRAKALYAKGAPDSLHLEEIFPELQDSDDDRIRKALITHIKYNVSVISGWRKEELIAWLEKQDSNRLEKEIEKAYKTADEVQYRKGFEDGVASIKTAEWSEDDEKMCKNLLECLRYGWRKLPTDVSKYESWLKSLRPHPKQDWNEEDERICQCLIEDQRKALNEVKNDKYGHSEIISDLKEMYRERIEWLESLKQKIKEK